MLFYFYLKQDNTLEQDVRLKLITVDQILVITTDFVQALLLVTLVIVEVSVTFYHKPTLVIVEVSVTFYHIPTLVIVEVGVTFYHIPVIVEVSVTFHTYLHL
jgi:hypothetical protein